jgi:hypothetical protein
MISVAHRVDITKWLLATFLLAGLLTAGADVRAAEPAAKSRVSITIQGPSGVVSTDEFGAIRMSEAMSKSIRPASLSKATAETAQSASLDFWFYSVDVELFSDLDRDGYYQGIDLLFDADTYFSSAEVYAVVYLSLEGGPWNEYAATENFSLFGASGDDDYNIVTELVSGYPTGSYDILIELFDAYDDSFLAYYGPDDTPELAFLPLEDSDRDFAVVPEVIVIKRGGGGALDSLVILMFGLAALLQYRRRRAALCDAPSSLTTVPESSTGSE